MCWFLSTFAHKFLLPKNSPTENMVLWASSTQKGRWEVGRSWEVLHSKFSLPLIQNVRILLRREVIWRYSLVRRCKEVFCKNMSTLSRLLCLSPFSTSGLLWGKHPCTTIWLPHPIPMMLNLTSGPQKRNQPWAKINLVPFRSYSHVVCHGDRKTAFFLSHMDKQQCLCLLRVFHDEKGSLCSCP